jgi:hypothetical protein
MEVTVKTLEEKSLAIEAKLNRIKRQKIDKTTLREAFTSYIQAIKTFPPEKRKEIYREFFEKIISTVDSKAQNGEITIKVRADGDIIRKWSELKDFKLNEDAGSNLRLEVYH